MIALLGRAGCVSIEAGVESITEAGREMLDKKCKVSTDELAGRLIFAKQLVPFVQANLIEMQEDDPAEVEAFRVRLNANGVWANKPVPLFPYPGSPEYTRRWGAPDDVAWERAHARISAILTNSVIFRSPVQSRWPSWSWSRLEMHKFPHRVLMTADAVGGVWTYALELCRGLTPFGVEVLLAVMGGGVTEAKRREVASISNVRLEVRDCKLEWMQAPWEDVAEAGDWLLGLAASFAPDIVHLNGYAHAALGWDAPVVVVAHSCVLSWFRAVRTGTLPQNGINTARWSAGG